MMYTYTCSQMLRWSTTFYLNKVYYNSKFDWSLKSQQGHLRTCARRRMRRLKKQVFTVESMTPTINNQLVHWKLNVLLRSFLKKILDTGCQQSRLTKVRSDIPVCCCTAAWDNCWWRPSPMTDHCRMDMTVLRARTRLHTSRECHAHLVQLPKGELQYVGLFPRDKSLNHCSNYRGDGGISSLRLLAPM